MASRVQWSWFTIAVAVVGAACALDEPIIVELKLKKDVVLLCPIPDTEFAVWYRGDRELEFSERYSFPSLTEVKISGVTEDDQGNYSCRKPFGIESIRKFILKSPNPEPTTPKPFGEPPSWTLIPSPTNLVRSTGITILACRATGIPTPRVTAYRVHQDGTRSELPLAGIALRRPKASDAGQYECLAENIVGQMKYQFEVSVIVDGGVSEWSAWSACDQPCSYGHKRRTRTCTNPEPSNGGRECNEALTEITGCKERSCSAPRVIKFGFDLSSGDLVLSCNATGLPTPSVKWHYNGNDLPSYIESNVPEMRIPKLKARNGQYGCTVKNAVGFITMYIDVQSI